MFWMNSWTKNPASISGVSLEEFLKELLDTSPQFQDKKNKRSFWRKSGSYIDELFSIIFRANPEETPREISEGIFRKISTEIPAEITKSYARCWRNSWKSFSINLWAFSGGFFKEFMQKLWKYLWRNSWKMFLYNLWRKSYRNENISRGIH